MNNNLFRTKLLLVGTIFAINLIGLPALAEANVRPCADTTPINTIKEMWPALFACWNSSPDHEYSEIWLIFSLRRDGTLIGERKVSARRIQGDQVQQRQFEAEVIAAIKEALPLPFSESMGSAIAGRVFLVRIKGDGSWSVRY